MHHQRNYGKRKLIASHSNSSDYNFDSPKNQRPCREFRPCRDIVYTEDRVPVRKLYFCVSASDITNRSLKKHFALFGPIDHFTLHHKLSYSYGFIQYKTVYSATSALRSQNHYVCGYKLKVSVADSWHQPVTLTTEDGHQIDGDAHGAHGSNSLVANHYFTPTPNDSDRLHMLDLNDDCLYHIFGMFNCIDLSAVDRTCTRFQRVASEQFKKKHTAINLTMTNLPGWSNIGARQLTLQQIRSLFMAYGSKIEKLQVTAVSFKQENRYRVLDLIIRSCTALKTLSLTGFYIKESLYRVNTTFFANLEELSFSLCEISDTIRRVFFNCHQLRKLIIQSDSNLNGSCLTIHFPQLESITLLMNSDIETRHLYTFFKLNHQLKSVKIIHCGGCIFDEIFPRIARNLPLLESLTIEVDYFAHFNENLTSLLRLEHLRELQLNCSMYSIASFVDSLAAKGKIELLHITDGLLNDSLIDAIVKCKKLTSLKLCSMPSVHNRFLAELATNLPELNDFHISKCQTLNATGVVQFANLAQNLKTLHISNSSVDIDDTFLQSLVTVYKQRGSRLTLSLNKIPTKVSPNILNENRQYVEVVRPSDNYLYDVLGDGLSDIDSDDDNDDDDDDNDDSDDGSWDDWNDSYEDIFDDDQLNALFDFNPNMWMMIY